jgi:hypothetical protein
MDITEDSFQEIGNFNQIIENKLLIESCTEFIEYVFYIKREKENNSLLWFRGLSHESYHLIPRIHRMIGGYDHHYEHHINTLFIKKAKPYLKYKNYTKFEWLHIMQHYGLPTRLLDWTEGAMLALYFAVRSENVEVPSVWILVPVKLNNITTEKKLIYVTDPDSSTADDKILDSYLDLEKLPKLPVAIEPPYIDTRIQSQKSVFTFHGSAYDGFMTVDISEELKLYKLKIKTECSYRIKKQLELLGITESTLFPDLEGISRELISVTEMFKTKFNLEYDNL